MVSIWKDVVGYEERFSVSSCGKVYSKLTKKELVLGMSKSGYRTLSTKVGGRNGVWKCFKIHRLVADAFVVRTREDRVFVNHIDGNKLNNDYMNLEWCTTYENNLHARMTGLSSTKHLIGVNKLKRKLTDSDVRAIRSIYKPSCRESGARALSRKYSTSHSVITDVVKLRSYLDVV